MAGYMCKRLVRAMCGDFIFYLFQRTGCPELIQERLRAAANAPVDETLYENQIPTGQRHQHQNRSEEHTSELQSLMRISYAVFCLKKKKTIKALIYIIQT